MFKIERKITKRDLPLVILFLLPGFLVFALAVIVPSALAINYSFYQASSFVGEATYVGLGNYIELLTDTRFWRDLWQTFVYAFGSISLQLILGILIALVLNKEFKGKSFVRGVSVVPYIIPVIVVTIGWEWILDTDFGIVNSIISMIGFNEVNFLSIDLAMFTAILLSVWTWTPFVTLVFLSGLQTIPKELYESSMIDGANSWQQFWRITLPMMKKILITIVLLRGLWMFNKFDLMWLLTGGGPLEKTETLPIYSYMNTFQLFQVGYGATIAVASAVIMLIIMLLFLGATNRTDKKCSLKRKKGVRTKVSSGSKKREEDDYNYEKKDIS